MMLCRLLDGLDCTLVRGRADTEVSAVFCDSCAPTPGCVSVCLPGQHTDGRRFAHAATAAVLVYKDALPTPPRGSALVQAKPGKTRRVLPLIVARLYGCPARHTADALAAITVARVEIANRRDALHYALELGQEGNIIAVLGKGTRRP